MSLNSLLDLSGRTALVTGGSRGLGLQIAEALGELGARVALVARKHDELDAAIAHLAQQGAAACAFACDLGDHNAIEPVIQRVHRELGDIDILVNNAGATWGAATADMPFDAWMKVLNLNLTATFLVTQRVARASMLPRRRGRIINVA